MKCFEETVYSIFLDNELNPEERKRVLTHLKECGKCQKIVERIKKENLRIKKIFETDYTPLNLIPAIMNKIISSESQYFREKNSWSFLVYGIFILTGILAPYFLSIYLKSTAFFQNFLSFIFTPFSLISSIVSFILREIIFITPEELTRIVVGQIFIIILLIIILRSYLIKQKKLLKEEYK
ncbi:MAG: anti-sigma factor family protein [Candidatus Aminicenantia bacterium]